MFSKQVIVLVNISYWMPDYSNIIQESTWQTGDISPTYPKVHNFLYYWKDNIDAVINDVILSTFTFHTYRRVDFSFFIFLIFHFSFFISHFLFYHFILHFLSLHFYFLFSSKAVRPWGSGPFRSHPVQSGPAGGT